MAEANKTNKNVEILFYIYGSDYLGGRPLVNEFMDLVGLALVLF